VTWCCAVGGEQFGADMQVPRSQWLVFDQDLLESSARCASVRLGAAEALRDGAGDQSSPRPTVTRTTSRRRSEKSSIGRRERAGLLHHLAGLLFARQLARLRRNTWTVRFTHIVVTVVLGKKCREGKRIGEEEEEGTEAHGEERKYGERS